MRLLFTKSGSLLSRAIRWLTKEPISHCAIEFGGYVAHSNLLGVHIELKETFEAHSTVVFAIGIEDSPMRLHMALEKADQHPYDFGALLYLGLRCLCPWLPKANLWQTTGMYLCTEWVTEVLYGEADSTITPFQLYERLNK